MNWKIIQKLLKNLLKGKQPKIGGKVKNITKKNTALVNKELGLDLKKYEPATRIQKIFLTSKQLETKLQQGAKLTKQEIAVYKEYKLAKQNPKKWFNTLDFKADNVLKTVAEQSLKDKVVIGKGVEASTFAKLKASEVVASKFSQIKTSDLVKLSGQQQQASIETIRDFQQAYQAKIANVLKTTNEIAENSILSGKTKLVELVKLVGEPKYINGKVIISKGIVEKNQELLNTVSRLKSQETENFLSKVYDIAPNNDLRRHDYMELFHKSKTKLNQERDNILREMANGTRKFDEVLVRKEIARLKSAKSITPARQERLVNLILDKQADNYVTEYADKYLNNGKNWYQDKIDKGWSEKKIKAHLKKQKEGYLKGRKEYFKQKKISLSDQTKKVLELFSGQFNWDDSPRDDEESEDEFEKNPRDSQPYRVKTGRR